MVYMLGRNRVEDFGKWQKAFDEGEDGRKSMGMKSCQVFKSCDDPDEITLLFEWESLEKAKEYMFSPEMAEKMKQSGIKGEPEIHFLERA